MNKLPKFGMLYDIARWEEKSLVNAAQRRGVEMALHQSDKLTLDISDDLRETFGDVVLQRCISYFRSLHLTGALELSSVKVINNLRSATIASNKLFASFVLAKAGVPTPRTMAAFSTDSALKALERLGYPAVLKPTVGSWGRLVSLVKDVETAEALIEHREQMFPLYQVYYLQEAVKRPSRDIRSFVIGGRVVAAIYRVSTEWRTNTARGGRAVNCPITPELEELSLKAAAAFGDGVFGVDCMEGPEGLVVHEVNNTIEFKNTVPATGVDIPGVIIDYMVESAR